MQRLTTTGRVTAAVVALAAAVTLGGLTTTALFTDQESVPDNQFTAGEVDITTSPTTTMFTVTNMMPGDVVTAPLTVNNVKEASRYAVLSTTTEGTLAAQLVLRIKSGVTTCTSGGFGASGTSLYSSVLGSTTGTKVVGDAATGNNAGDRALGAGASETLCFQVELPSASDNSFERLTTTATFRFDAEQTKNNN